MTAAVIIVISITVTVLNALLVGINIGVTRSMRKHDKYEDAKFKAWLSTQKLIGKPKPDSSK